MGYTFQYYDVVLGGVLASLLVSAGVRWLTLNPPAVTVPVFAILAAAIIGHGRFVNGPVDEPADLGEGIGAFE